MEALEGQHMAVTGKLPYLSAQNLVDCVKESAGCAGGMVASAYKYMIKHGIDLESCYPDTESKGVCKTCVGTTMKGVATIELGNEQKLKYATAKIGPISAVIDASQPSFQAYMGGIYDEPNCSSVQVDHPVLIVGYGTKDGVDFWIVRNSCGIEWGIKGYILMSRNLSNQCGIATAATYLTG